MQISISIPQQFFSKCANLYFFVLKISLLLIQFLKELEYIRCRDCRYLMSLTARALSNSFRNHGYDIEVINFFTGKAEARATTE